MITKGPLRIANMLSSTDTKPQDATACPATPGNGNVLLRQVRRVIIFVFGISVLVVGIVMIVAPGPAVVVIPLGLAILATEFVWAQRVLHRLKQGLADAHAGVSQANLPRWVRFFVPKKSGAGTEVQASVPAGAASERGPIPP
jgi:hypothetical protein